MTCPPDVRRAFCALLRACVCLSVVCQVRIAEAIQQQNIDEMYETAYEYAPEVFTRIHMLYVSARHLVSPNIAIQSAASIAAQSAASISVWPVANSDGAVQSFANIAVQSVANNCPSSRSPISSLSFYHGSLFLP
jgi:Aspartyl protease